MDTFTVVALAVLVTIAVSAPVNYYLGYQNGREDFKTARDRRKENDNA